MPVQIGAAPAHPFTEPVGLLSACHRRIEMFLDVILRVSMEWPGRALEGSARESLSTALRYFREMAPQHNQDEEESLFPRLRALDSAEARQLLQLMDALEREHAEASPQHARVDELASKWLNGEVLSAAEFQELHRVSSDLREFYRKHIAFEDKTLFPAAQRLLPADVLRQIGREMGARRGVTVA